MSSTQDWSFERLLTLFNKSGCTISGCPFRDVGGGVLNSCALDLSDAILRSGYFLPSISEPYNKCPHVNPRVRGADIMARLTRVQNNGALDASGWANRPSWKGIVFFEEPNPGNSLTGHIDLWDGSHGVHGEYSAWGGVIWFWRLATSPNDLLVGPWQSTDAQKRWDLRFADGACRWMERNTSGSTLIRNVYPAMSGGSYRIERPNDAEILTFLGARPSVRDQILARSPGPSSMLIRRSGVTATADWSGLFWTLDSSNNLATLGFRSRSFSLNVASP
jgi:hypothetical protein